MSNPSQEINIHELYPDLGDCNIRQLKNRIDRMMDSADKFDRNGLSTSAERSLTIAALLEDELNRRKTELGA